MARKTTGRIAAERFPDSDRMRLRVNPALFAEAILGLELDERQRELMLTLSRKVVLNCARQWGKSTMAAAKAVHRAMFRAGSLTIVLSPSSRQSAELVRKVRQLAAKAGERVKGDGENRASAVFRNGSRVVGLPAMEGTTRGFSNVSLLVVDVAMGVTIAGEWLEKLVEGTEELRAKSTLASILKDEVRHQELGWSAVNAAQLYWSDEQCLQLHEERCDRPF